MLAYEKWFKSIKKILIGVLTPNRSLSAQSLQNYKLSIIFYFGSPQIIYILLNKFTKVVFAKKYVYAFVGGKAMYEIQNMPCSNISKSTDISREIGSLAK